MLGRKAKPSLEKLGKARDYLDPALHVGDLDIPTKIALTDGRRNRKAPAL